MHEEEVAQGGSKALCDHCWKRGLSKSRSYACYRESKPLKSIAAVIGSDGLHGYLPLSRDVKILHWWMRPGVIEIEKRFFESATAYGNELNYYETQVATL